MGIPKNLTTFFNGNLKKKKHYFGFKGKEDMGIPKLLIVFSTGQIGVGEGDKYNFFILHLKI